jgi:hypothetical protein
MSGTDKLGTAAKQMWEQAKRKTEARVAHARGDITDAQLAEILGPPPPPGTSLGDVIKTIRQAPEGTFAGMLRKTGQEIARAVARRTASRKDGE